MTTKNKLLTVIYNFIPFESLITFQLYKNLGLSLDNYCEDISRVIRTQQTMPLFYTGFLLDLEYMLYMFNSDTELNIEFVHVKNEIDKVIKLLIIRIEQVDIKNTKLIGMNFEQPEFLILDFAENE